MQWPQLALAMERELSHAANHPAEHLEPLLDERGQDLLRALADKHGEVVTAHEDLLLLLVGTLCLRNGQPALWSAIWHTFQHPIGHPVEDEFQFLARMTTDAIRAIIP